MIAVYGRPLLFSASDKDYNDFVVELKAIPEPATISLLGFGIFSLVRRRR
jgi:hypothetical protein